MNVKYQVFVSSTYEDLKVEREQVLKAALEMGHIPVGMEMFSAADEQQWEIIKRQIEQSDYYVVIIAHRYGSLVEGISFTEKEYDYAVQCGVPALGFIIEESASWPNDRRDTGAASAEKAAKLQAFKEKVKRKPVGFWKSAEDLHAKVSIALIKTFTAQPRTGWIPASQAASPQTASELSRLSAENAQLRHALEEATRSSAQKEEAEWHPILTAMAAARILDGDDGLSLLEGFNGIGSRFARDATISDGYHAMSELLDQKYGGATPHGHKEIAWDNWVDEMTTLNLIEARKSVNGTLYKLTGDGRRLLAFVRRKTLTKAPQPAPSDQPTTAGSRKGDIQN